MLYILVTTILPDNIVKLIPIKKGNYLGENEFVLEHKVQILVLHKFTNSSPFTLKTSVINYISIISKNFSRF